MKLLIMFFLLSLVSANIFAQDTIKRNQIPVRLANRMVVTKKMTTQDAIAYDIKRLLDSLANKSLGDVLRLSTVKAEIETILYPYWKSGKLAGSTAMQAYFIQTGLQTMTQVDIQQGRLLVKVGIAPIKPAEFNLLQFEQLIQNKKLVID
jgi:phage tail sheath protein FI